MEEYVLIIQTDKREVVVKSNEEDIFPIIVIALNNHFSLSGETLINTKYGQSEK